MVYDPQISQIDADFYGIGATFDAKVKEELYNGRPNLAHLSAGF